MSYIKPDIILDISTLVFVQHQDGGALFLDEDGDKILFIVTGNKADHKEAVEQIRKATVPSRSQV
jgi:hypothetical protein